MASSSLIVGIPWLAVLQFWPLVGAMVVWRLGETPRAVVVGRIWAVSSLIPACIVLALIDDRAPGWQLAERVSFLGYHVAADGVTTLFILLTTLIGALSVLYGLARKLTSPARLLATILAAEAALLVCLCTLNLLWFALASLAEIGLVAQMLGRWSTSTEGNRQLAMARFTQFQGFGWLLLAAGIFLLAWTHADLAGGQWTFDLTELAQRTPPGKFQSVVFFLMFYGLAVRTPLFPLHGWLPHVTHRGMVAIAPGLLLGVKLGIYGMFRFLLPLTPDAAAEWQLYVVGFAMTGVFFAATLAFMQTNLRRLLSFAVVSHTSLLVIGLFTLHPVGLQGALMLSVNFGLAVTLMLFMVGFVFSRTATTDLDRLGGLFERIPFIAVAFLIGGLSIVGMPGTPGFDAAHLVLEASIAEFGALPTVATALGNVVAAGFLLWAFQRAFLAPAPSGAKPVERTLAREWVVGCVVIAVLLLVGFFPEPWLRLTDLSTHTLGQRFDLLGAHP